MNIYIIPFTIKPDSYWVMDIGGKKLRKFVEWLWFRFEY
jgi:hypothetical protein